MVSLNPDQVKAVYMEGPKSIHVQISDEVLRHVDEDSMFSLSVLQENGSHVFLLRKKPKHWETERILSADVKNLVLIFYNHKLVNEPLVQGKFVFCISNKSRN